MWWNLRNSPTILYQSNQLPFSFLFEWWRRWCKGSQVVMKIGCLLLMNLVLVCSTSNDCTLISCNCGMFISNRCTVKHKSTRIIMILLTPDNWIFCKHLAWYFMSDKTFFFFQFNLRKENIECFYLHYRTSAHVSKVTTVFNLGFLTARTNRNV